MHILSLAGKHIPLGATAQKPKNTSGKIEYHHHQNLTEWYHNGTEAMEHGYTITQRPPHLQTEQDVVIEVALQGLTASNHTNDDGSHQLNFTDGERTILSYSKLLVLDANGKELPATMQPTENGFTLAYHDAKATYPITVDPLIVNEEAQLTADDSATSDNFGRSVSISGDSVVVGAPGNDDAGSFSGSAYIFTRTGSSWSLQAKLTADDAAATDLFGWSVAISGNSVVVGAYRDDDNGTESGSAYIFTRTGNSWSLQTKLTASDAAAGDQFGLSVALSGDSAIISAYLDDDTASGSGSAYVFTRSGDSWSQQGKLTASDAAAFDNFGFSVAISGDSVVVGANRDDDAGSASGSAYVFTRSSSIWSQQAKLTASDAAAGDEFGRSVAISGNYAIISSHEDDDGGPGSGSAYVFVRSGATWTQQNKLTANDAAPIDNFGSSVAINGNHILVGSPGSGVGVTGKVYAYTRSGNSWFWQNTLNASDATSSNEFGRSLAMSSDSSIIGANVNDTMGSFAGSAYIFTRSGNSWSEQAKLTANDTAIDDNFGYSVAIAGDSAVVGAYFDDDAGLDSGSAYVFTRNNSTWSLQTKLTASDATVDDQFGYSVAISGDSTVIGALQTNDAGTSSGSAYVFTRTGSSWSQQAKLTASDAASNDLFGISVSISGDSVTVGAYQNDEKGIDSGSAYVFIRSGSSWSQQAKLTASDAAVSDLFGVSVDISGDSIVIGAFGDDDSGTDSGSAYVFTRSGSTWSQQAKLTASDAADFDFFGVSVAISGDSIAVGAQLNDNAATNAGSAYVFTRSGSAWSQQAQLTASNAGANKFFGISVDISGDSVVVGSHFDNPAGSFSGSAYIFTRSGSTWSEQNKLIASNAAAGDRFGLSVAISGDSVIVGASRNDAAGSDSGSAYIYRTALPFFSKIIVYDTTNQELLSGSSATPFLGQKLDTSTNYTFRITNAGEGQLAIFSITLSGTNAAQFSVNPVISSSISLAQHESLDFTITFHPTGSNSGIRQAIASIDSSDNIDPSFNISGLGLSNELDTDNDGLNDLAEYSLRGFGFIWTKSQPNKASNMLANAPSAGLYTQAEASNVNGTAVFSNVDTSNNTAIFTIELEESFNLQTFTPITLDPAKLSIDTNGNIRYQLDAPLGKKFYRAGLKE